MTTTSLIQPKNKEQELAIEAGKEFLKNGSPADWGRRQIKVGLKRCTYQ